MSSQRQVWRVLCLTGLCFVMGGASSSQSSQEENSYQEMREAMVDKQLVGRGIRDPRVLEAMRKVPRQKFLPWQLRGSAYADGPLPIGHNQTISQPYIVAYMTELLEIRPEDRVLEIGTGSGYQAAVLAEMAQEVFSIEILEPLYRRAKKTLEGLGYRNISLRLGDGWKGWPEAAPFDKIMVTAAATEIPQALIQQLKPQGKIICPVGEWKEAQYLLLGIKEGETVKTAKKIPVRFVPLVQGDASKKV